MKDKIKELIHKYEDEMVNLNAKFEYYEQTTNLEMQCNFDGRYVQLRQVIIDLEKLIR
jgi:hypothetical protein